MNRRALLKTIGGSAAFGLAGCLTRRNDSRTERQNGTTQTRETDGTSTETDGTPTETDGTSTETDDGCPDGPDLVNRSFDVVSARCGTGENESSASFETNSVHVSGTIDGSNSCYTAKLEDVACEEGTLTVPVRSYEREDEDVCSMCVADVEYEADFDFENGLPQRIVVLHNGTEVLNQPRE